MNLDRIDLKILAALAEEGRLSWRDLADRVGLSTTPVLRRVNALEGAGYIRGYSANLDEASLAGEVNVFVSVRLKSQDADTLAEFEGRVVAMGQVMSCHLTTGDDDYLLRVVCQSLDDFQRFLTEHLARTPGVSHVKSSFALKTVLQRKAPLLL